MPGRGLLARLCGAAHGFAWRCALLLFFVLGLGFLLLRHLAMPQLAAHRADIEAALSRTLGVEVRIAALDARWTGLRPELDLRGLRFIGADGENALELPEVRMSVGWSSLWHFEPRLHRLEILRPELDIRREADGRIFVAGLPLGSGNAGQGNPAARDFVLRQGQILIRGGRVTWTDLQRNAPPLQLNRVELRLDNLGSRHRFALRASPPEGSSSSLDLRGDLRGQSFAALDGWRGKLYLALDDADLAIWQKWADYPLYLPRGRGGLRAWLDFDGRDVTGLSADVALADLSLRMGEGVPQFDLAALQGRLQFSLRKGVIDASAEGLSLVAQDGLRIGPTRLRLHYEPQTAGRAARGDFSTEQQDVQVLARLASFLPLSGDARQKLAMADPSGRVEAVSFSWEGSAPGVRPARAIAHFKVAARASGLSLHPVGALPGFAGLDTEFSGSDQSGRFELAIRAGGFYLPAEMHEPWLPLDRARLIGTWSHEKPDAKSAPALTIRLAQGELANAHLDARVSGSWQARERGPGWLDIKASAPSAPLAEVWRYIPHAAPVEVVDWLRRSLAGGRADNLRFQLSGELEHFPFNKSPGVFRLEAGIRDGAIAEFAHGWPGLQALQGSFLLDRQRILIRADSGHYGNAVARGVKVEIPDLMTPGKQVLTVDGRAGGPNPDFLRYVNASHLAEMSGGFTRDIRAAQGSGELSLKLEVPLHDGAHTRVDGSYAFQAPELRLTPVLPDFSAVRATLGFTERGLSLPAASAQFLGRRVSASGLTEADGTLRFDAQGSLTVAGLRQLVALPGWDFLAGETPVAVVVKSHGNVLEVLAESSLAGIGSSLPPPFTKGAGERWPLRFSLRREHGDSGAAQLWRVSLPGRLDLVWGEHCGAQACRSDGGSLMIGENAELPPQGGWLLGGRVAELDADRWQPVIGHLLPDGMGGGAAGGEGTGGEISAVFRVGRLETGGYVFREVSARARKRGPEWSASVDGPDIAGSVSWRDQDEGLLKARLSRLRLVQDDTPRAPVAPPAVSSKVLPALDVSAEAFEMRGLKLGALNLLARNEDGLWKLDEIGLKTPDMELSGSGEWQAGGRGAGTRLDFHLRSGNAGAMLDRLGYRNTVRRGKVDFGGSVRWIGAPTALDFASLDGRVKLDASDGQFSEMEPGAGRLLGILSLQSLPRRITLDFRDVFSAGFAFDRISGDMNIVGGVLHTNDLEVRGPAARVFIVGAADLGRETLDLKLRIQPTLSETVAVGVIVGQAAVGVLNPAVGAVGAATYLAQKLLRDPVEKIFSYEYTMRGNWNDPKVERAGGSLLPNVGEAEPAVSRPVDGEGQAVVPQGKEKP